MAPFRALALGHLLIVVACFAVEEPVEQTGTLNSRIQEKFSNDVSDFEALHSKFIDTAQEAKTLRRKARKLNARVSAMPRGLERKNGEALLKAATAKVAKTEAEQEKLATSIQEHKKKLQAAVKTTAGIASSTHQQATSKSLVLTKRLKLHRGSLKSAKKSLAQALNQLNAAADVPEKVVTDSSVVKDKLKNAADDTASKIESEEVEVQSLTYKQKKNPNSKKANAALRKAKAKLSDLSKIRKRIEDARKKFQASTAALPKPAEPKVVTPCQKAYTATVAKCPSAAVKQVKQMGLISNILKNQAGTADLSPDTNSGYQNQVDKKLSECRAKAQKFSQACETAYDAQLRERNDVKKVYKALGEQKAKVDEAAELQKTAAKHNIKVQQLLSRGDNGAPTPVGIFLHDNAVWYVDRNDKKSLVKFPTSGCSRATHGIDPNSFDNEANDKLFFMDKKASEKACDGPVYQNIENPGLWLNCECSGASDKNKEGGSCASWGGKQNWCYVVPTCAHPNTKTVENSKSKKQLFGCHPDEN
jgi:hypothetical protein